MSPSFTANPLFTQAIKPLYLRARYLRSRVTDHRLGIMTTGECVVPESSHEAVHFRDIQYRNLSYFGAQRLMRHLAAGPNDAFLDLGCGRGRVISVAAQYPLSRVIGVEIDGKACAVAERNARTLRRFAVRPEVVRADAATYVVPDDITIAFLYNSFGGEVLRSALSRLLDSYDRTPRRIRLAYANPREHDLVMSMGRFREAGWLWMSWRPGAEWARTQMIRLYEVEPRR
jgi:SAM-dependent methyltransferase